MTTKECNKVFFVLLLVTIVSNVKVSFHVLAFNNAAAQK